MPAADGLIGLRLAAGTFADAGSWVYAWCSDSDRSVFYIGATGLPPAVRTWLHLHDPDPAVGRVAALRPGVVEEAVRVLACPVDGDRVVVKASVIAALSAAGLLSPDYVGPAPDPAALDPVTAAPLLAAVRALG